MRRVCTGIFCLLASVALAGTEQPVEVTVEQLLAKPENFNGRRVDVTGYYRAGMEDSYLFASKRTRGNIDNAIYIDPILWDPSNAAHRTRDVLDPNAMSDHFIRVVGRFRYRKLPQNQEARIRAVMHGEGEEKVLIEVTYFRPTK